MPLASERGERVALPSRVYAPELSKTISRHKLEGGDVDGALELIATTRRRLEKLGKRVRVVSVYEAGYDGFCCIAG